LPNIAGFLNFVSSSCALFHHPKYAFEYVVEAPWNRKLKTKSS